MTAFDVNHPLIMIAVALTMIVLLALTMRSVIMREKAMIRQRRQDPDVQSAYESRWRDLAA